MGRTNEPRIEREVIEVHSSSYPPLDSVWTCSTPIFPFHIGDSRRRKGSRRATDSTSLLFLTIFEMILVKRKKNVGIQNSAMKSLRLPNELQMIRRWKLRGGGERVRARHDNLSIRESSIFAWDLLQKSTWCEIAKRMFQTGRGRSDRIDRRLAMIDVLTPNMFDRLMFLLGLIEIISRMCWLHCLSLRDTRIWKQADQCRRESSGTDCFSLLLLDVWWRTQRGLKLLVERTHLNGSNQLESNDGNVSKRESVSDNDVSAVSNCFSFLPLSVKAR